MPAHIAIIGAGPAGSSAAIGLAWAGAAVTIIEARAFPRDKVCGEFITPAGTRLLVSLVSPSDLLAAGARRVDRLWLEVYDRCSDWPMPRPAWALSRRTLDTLLLERAADAGATVLQPCRAAGVRYTDTGVMIDLADGRTLAADLVIHADGSGRHDPAGPTLNRPGVLAHKCHLAAPHAVPGVRMRSARGAYVGTIQVEDGLATCALVARRTLIAAHRGDADSMLAGLWPEFRPGWRIGDWLCCGVPASGYIRPGHARSLRVGNAAAAVEPIGGEGIGLALWSGTRVAELLGRWGGLRGHGSARLRPDSIQRIQSIFAQDYRRRLRWRRPACRVAAETLMRPSLVRALWPTLAAPGLTIRPWYALTGKPV